MFKINTFVEFILEKKQNKKDYKPLEGGCVCVISGKKFEFNVGELVKWAKENYKQVNLPLTKIKGFTLYKDLDSETVPNGQMVYYCRKMKGGLDVVSFPKDSDPKKELGKNWKKFHKMTQKEWEENRESQLEIVEWADLRYAIVCSVNDKGKITGILDGNHRAYKAYKQKKKTIKAYLIPESDLVKFK